MRAAALALLTAACTGAAARAQSEPELLPPGTELIYASEGAADAVWRVDTSAYGLEFGGRSGCRRVRFAPGGPRAGLDDRITCTAGDTLFAWDAPAGTWRVARPVAPLRVFTIPGQASVARYQTGEAAEEAIGALRLQVIPTVITTVDSSGAEVRRLRERNAPALGTATWGVFEVPDSAAPGGWRVSRAFRLKEVRPPSPGDRYPPKP